ncbi:DoxX family protein [Streptosporangium sp. NPDC049644]|uniref:DoxX family protein n=1 Tax=Streptosporangium sp. NPDC049644 TaxID=3155507 RepID=UPI003437A3A3
MGTTDGAVLLIRVAVGAIFIVHGLNHAFGGGKLAGTARWFAGLGMRHPRLQAVMSVAVEVAAGTALAIGLLTPVAAGALVGVAVVAGLAAHARNGFFVFKDGYEYVLLLAVTCLAVALAGPGGASLDAVLGIDALADGWVGLAVALLVGVGGAAVLLLATWRPVRDRA